MKQYKNHTLQEYLNVLAQKTPIPGGGSVVAYTAALGVALLGMVARYAEGKSSPVVDKKVRKIIAETERMHERLLILVDRDAQAYLEVTKSRKKSPEEYQRALKTAREVPLEVCRICYKAIDAAPFLVEKGSKYLISDVAVACELLLSSFNGALTLAQYN